MIKWKNAVSGVCKGCGLITVVVADHCVHCTRWQARLDEGRVHVEALLNLPHPPTNEGKNQWGAAIEWLIAQDGEEGDDGIQ